MKNKNPLFKFRYIEGMGDLIRCVIHSKFIAFFIGEREYCVSCSQRSYALNLLFGLPIWKFFFKNKEEMRKSFKLDAENFGYTYVGEENTNSTSNEIITHSNIQKFDTDQIKYDGYYFSGMSEADYDNIRIVTIAFKKIDTTLDT